MISQDTNNLQERKVLAPTSSTQSNKQVFTSWSKARILDELINDLAAAYVYVEDDTYGFTWILPKYYEKAAYWLYRIPVYEPTPFFEIDVHDLSCEVKKELAELKKSDPKAFHFTVKMAVTHIFENIGFRYTHRSMMRYLRIRFVSSSTE